MAENKDTVNKLIDMFPHINETQAKHHLEKANGDAEQAIDNILNDKIIEETSEIKLAQEEEDAFTAQTLQVNFFSIIINRLHCNS